MEEVDGLHGLAEQEGEGEREAEGDAAEEGRLEDGAGASEVGDPSAEGELEETQGGNRLAGAVEGLDQIFEHLAGLVGQSREVALDGGALDLLVLEVGVLAGVVSRMGRLVGMGGRGGGEG